MAPEPTADQFDGCTPDQLAAEVERRWFDRLHGAGGLTGPAVRDLYYYLLTALADSREGPQLVLVDGRWAENPHYGDRTFYLAEQRRLWDEIGRTLGIGPPPDSSFDA